METTSTTDTIDTDTDKTEMTALINKTIHKYRRETTST